MGSIKLIIKILKTHKLRWDQSRTNINDFKTQTKHNEINQTNY